MPGEHREGGAREKPKSSRACGARRWPKHPASAHEVPGSGESEGCDGSRVVRRATLISCPLCNGWRRKRVRSGIADRECAFLRHRCLVGRELTCQLASQPKL